MNGAVSHPPGGTGDYTVDEADCRGALTFTGGPSFDIVAARDGGTLWMFQTNANTVFQGTATRLNH